MGKSKARGQKPQKPESCSLSYREERFVEEYIRTGNATRAAIVAGYRPTSARTMGSRLLTKVDISEAIAGLREQARDKAKVDRDDLIEKLVIIALGDPGDVVSWGPKGFKMKSYRSAGPNRHMIESFSESESESSGEQGWSSSKSKSVKFRDKIKAIDELWKKLGFENATGGRDREAFAETIRRAMDRVRK